MNLHQTTGRWKLGLALALCSAFMWGLLPIALKGVLDGLDAYTTAWFRFFGSGVLVGAFVIYKKNLPSPTLLRGPVLLLLSFCVVGLCGNYLFFNLGLDHVSPSTAAVVIQMAPIFMLLGSLILFKESFNLRQWLGFGVLLFGLGLFFNQRLGELLSSLGDYTVGVMMIVAAGAVWSIYALAQKQLLRTLPSGTIMLLIYVACSVLLLPLAHVSNIATLPPATLLLLIFCALNTIAAYGCFAEALDHWQASRVSAILATTPLITVFCMKLCNAFFPNFIVQEHLNTASIIGAVLVVCGSVLCALGRQAAKE
jgi:drug/metabolite transporter (DMT)-like permease